MTKPPWIIDQSLVNHYTRVGEFFWVPAGAGMPCSVSWVPFIIFKLFFKLQIKKKTKKKSHKWPDGNLASIIFNMVELVSAVSTVPLADLQQPNHRSGCMAPQPPDSAWFFLSEGLPVALRQLRQVISLTCSLWEPSSVLWAVRLTALLVLADFARYVRASWFRGDQLSGRETRCYPDDVCEQSARRWNTTCC